MSGLAQASCRLTRVRDANLQAAFGRPRNRTKYAYDAANRLLSGLISGSTPQYQYVYDHASNVTSITPDGPTQTFSYTDTNAIAAGSYDANGSPTALGGNSYIWDGANRVVNFANSAAHTSSSFTYDGFGRLVRVVDTKSGTVTADHSYFWCGAVRCLGHDNTQSGSPVTTQYFAQGIIGSGTAYYYVQDLLGSVTQLVSSSGNVAAQYAYDPYGNRTLVTGTVVSDVGYAGYFYHANSGLEFALYRAYDPVHARWLNRDPLGEAGGLNLYAYVSDTPVSLTDPSGFKCKPAGPWSTESQFRRIDTVQTVLEFVTAFLVPTGIKVGLSPAVEPKVSLRPGLELEFEIWRTYHYHEFGKIGTLRQTFEERWLVCWDDGSCGQQSNFRTVPERGNFSPWEDWDVKTVDRTYTEEKNSGYTWWVPAYEF